LLALFHPGGTEQRGPQNVNGGHHLMGRVIVRPIAEKLGDAIAMRFLGPGDARRTSKALGKKRFEMKVDDMVKPIGGMTCR
jgi:creatinine amidohydrolase/Fe(II)-dependent formamide hydrolase-like protein